MGSGDPFLEWLRSSISAHGAAQSRVRLPELARARMPPLARAFGCRSSVTRAAAGGRGYRCSLVACVAGGLRGCWSLRCMHAFVGAPRCRLPNAKRRAVGHHACRKLFGPLVRLFPFNSWPCNSFLLAHVTLRTMRWSLEIQLFIY